MVDVYCSLIDVLDLLVYFYFVFFFKQKTAYEMRISDWSSDVCSSDLSARSAPDGRGRGSPRSARRLPASDQRPAAEREERQEEARRGEQIGRASCRERVCQYV